MSNRDVRYRISADDAPFAAAIRRVDAGLRGVDDRVTGALSGIAGTVGRISGMVGAVGALLTGGTFVAGLNNAIALQDEMSKGAQRAGLTTEAWSTLTYAAKLTDLSVQDLEKSVAKLSATLVNGQQGQREAIELFRRLKLDPQNVKDADQFLQELADRFAEMPNGITKTALAVDTFGEKLGPKLIPFLNQGRAGIEQLREEARKLGVEVSTAAGRQAEEFSDNLARIKTAASAAANVLAAELLPSLVRGSEYFVKAAKDAGFFQAVLISIGALMAKGLGIDEVGEVSARLEKLKEQAALVQRNLADMQRERGATAAGVAEKLMVKLKVLQAEILKTSAELARLNAGSPEAKGGRGFVNPANAVTPTPFVPEDKAPDGPKAPKVQAPDSYMAYYRELLAEEERAQTILSQGREFGKQEEAAFWRFILDNVQVTAKDRVAILRRSSELEADIVRGAARDRVAIDRENIGASEQLALAQVEAERAAAASLLETHEITGEQVLELERGFAERQYDIRRAALEARLELAQSDPGTNPAELARLKNEMLLIEQQYQADVGLLNEQASQEQRTRWNGLWSDMQSGFSQVIAGFLRGTLTLSQTIRGLFAAMGNAIINTIAQIAAQWLVQQVVQRMVSKITAADQIMANSAVAGAGGVASMAAAPWPLNMTAPMFGAAMAATAAAYLTALPSAEGGWDIPAGVNPITQLHEQEMVLPKDVAEPVREMAENGGPQSPQIVLQGYRHGNWFITELPALAKALEYGKRNFLIKT